MVVMVISALDKTIFAFAGAHIIDELKLSPEQFGFVGSSFFFLYSISGVLVGFLANRFATRWILVAMAIVWMVAQALVTFSDGLALLIVSRLLLGAGTGPATAVTLHACFKWFRPEERVLPSSLIYSSMMFGVLVGALSLPFAIEQMGWRAAYFCLAIAGLIWLGLWLMLGGEGRYGTHSNGPIAVDSMRLPYKALLLNRTFVCVILLGFFCYVPTALGFSWTVVYLKKGLNLESQQAGYFMLGITVLTMIGGLAVSTLSQRAMKRGGSVFRTMILPPFVCSLLGGLMFLGIGFAHGNTILILALLFFGTALVNVLPSFSMAITAHFTPSGQRGSVLAINNAFQTSAGMITPFLVGTLVAWRGNEMAEGFELAVSGFGAATILCALVGSCLADPEHTRKQLVLMTEQVQQRTEAIARA